MKLTIGRCSVCVEVDGKEVDCYDVQYSEVDKKTTCWIASEAGKEFRVKSFLDTSGGHFISCALSIDSISCENIFAPSAHSTVPKDTDIIIFSHMRTSTTTAKKLVFSNLQLTDEDQYLAAPHPDASSIKLVARYYNLGNQRPDSEEDYRGQKVPGGLKVHEKTKKGLVHGIQLGASTAVRPKTVYNGTYGDSIGTFVFRYTSRDVLQARDLVPAIAPLQPPEVEAPPNQPEHAPPVLDPDASDAVQKQLLRLKRENEELQSRLFRVKRERGDDDDDVVDLTDDSRTTLISRKKPKASDEVVDLTLD